MSIPYKHDLTDLAETPVAFSGIDILDAGADAIELPNEVAFFRDTFSLNTQADGLGFAVTGFLFIEEVASLSDYWGRLVYRKIQITDPTYQAGHVYAFGDVAGSVIGAADVNRLDDEDAALQGQIDTNAAAIAAHETRLDDIEYLAGEDDPRIGYAFPNGQFERDAASWNTYANAVQSTPVDGTGGTPVGVTFARSASSPLAGAASGVLTKGAVNAQGEGVSCDFTVDSGKRGEAMQVTFAFDTSGAYADGDVGAYLYDKVNAVLIPLSVASLPYSTGFSTKFLARAFLNANSADYRLILHVQSANASAWALKVDDVRVGEATLGTGAAIGEWQSYTPTFQGFGTPTGVEFQWRRVGSNVEIIGRMIAGTTTAVEPQVGLPSGLTTKTSLPAISLVGDVAHSVANTTFFRDCAVCQPNKAYINFSQQTSMTNVLTIATSASGIFGTGTTIAIRVSVPIDQWTSNVNLASDFTEYAFNTQASPNTNDTTSFGYGSGGTPILANTSVTYHDVRFVRPIQPTDTILLEVRRKSDGVWVPVDRAGLTSLYINALGPGGYVNTSGNWYSSGVLLSGSAVTNGLRILWMATASFAGSAWTGSSVTGRSWSAVIAAADGYDRWRVRKVSNGNMAEVPPLVYAEYRGVIAADSYVTSAMKIEDNYSSFNANNEWAVPFDGIYQFNLTQESHCYLFAGAYQLHFYLNGAQVMTARDYVGGDFGSGQSVMYTRRLKKGDLMKFKRYTDGSDNNPVYQLSIVRLGS